MNDPAVFREQLDTIFHVGDGPDTISLRLAEVAGERVGGGLQQFSLLFHGPADHILPQGMYAMRHDTLGSLAMFIVPIVGSNQERTVYEACFSRRVPPPPSALDR